MSSRFTSDIPADTREWLLGEDNPAVAVLTRRLLGGSRRLRWRCAMGSA